jgi:hypothetical protein
MGCTLVFNQGGSAVGANDKNGNYSQVFQQILNSPFIQTGEEAIRVYSNVFEGDEIPVTYENKSGEVFSSYRNAIKATDSGDITAKSGETELFRVNSDSNPKTFNGLINNLIKSDLISDITEVDTDGKKLYKPYGYSELKQMITSDSAITTARGFIGFNAQRDAKGNLYFDIENIGKRTVVNASGQQVQLTQEEIDNLTLNSVNDPVGLMVEREYKATNRTFGNTKPVEEIEVVPENVLQERLFSLLRDMGVKVISLENYNRKYKPNAQALADIANQLVAFKDGEITTEDLTEETAHFIIETTDATTLEGMLRNVHRTQEWQQYAETYQNIYQNDEQVRKEVLGKVLANSLQRNFVQEQNSPTANTIIGRLREIFNNFIETIRGYFKPLYQQQLEQYTKNVYDKLIANSLYYQLDSQQLQGKEYVYYSLEQAGVPQEYIRLERTINELHSQQTQLSSRFRAPASQQQLTIAREEVDKAKTELQAEIEQLSKIKAITAIVQVAESQVDYLTRAFEKNNKDNLSFSQEEQNVLQNMDNKIRPALSQIAERLNPKTPQEKAAKVKIDSVLSKLNSLNGKLPEYNEKIVQMLVDQAVRRSNMSPQQEAVYREDLHKVFTTAQKDTAWFQAHLGQLVHAQNPLLNLSGTVIADTHTEARMTFINRGKDFLNALAARNETPQTVKRLFGKDKRLLNSVDQAKKERIDLEAQVRFYNEATGENILIENFSFNTIKTLSTNNPEQYRLYKTLFENWRRQNMVPFYRPEYNERFESITLQTDRGVLSRNDIPEVALEFDKSHRAQLSQIRIGAEDGMYTKGDIDQITELNRVRQEKTSPINEDGTLKKGLVEVYDNTLKRYVVRLSEDIDSMDNETVLEAQIIVGLQNLQLLNREFNKDAFSSTKEIPQSFVDKLNEYETEQEKWEFVLYNSYLGFPQDFWDNFGDNASLRDRLLEAQDGQNNEEIETLIEDIRAQQRIISNLLRKYRVTNQPYETDVASMSNLSKSSIRDASIQLESLYAKANTFLPQAEQVENESFSEIQVNEAFSQDLSDEGVQDVMDFIKKNVTPKNKLAIEKAERIADIISKGEVPVISRTLQNIFTEEMSASEAQEALLNYAKSKLLPYYKRTEPIGFSQERTALQNGIANNIEGTVENFILTSEYTEVSPQISFRENNEAINPEWIANNEAKRPQYTKEYLRQIRNDEYYERYGIDENENPTRNLEEWETRQIFLDMTDNDLELVGLTGQKDRYLPPQQHKTAQQRLANFTVSGLRESLNDLTNFREDSEDINRDEEGTILSHKSTILSIPRYGFNKLSNQEDVNDNYIYSYLWRSQQAYLHKARKNNIGKMMALEAGILRTDVAGKSAESSNTYKMFKSFYNSNIFGIKESFNLEKKIGNRKVNLGRIAKVFNSWTRTVALSGTTIPLTSLFQGKLQAIVDRQVGEIINPIAYDLARKETYPKMGAAASETLSLNSNADLNVYGEFFGWYDLTNRFRNATFNTFNRGVLEAKNGFHALGNFPVIPQLGMAVVMDYRYYNNRLYTYNQFLRTNSGRNRKELSEEWKQLSLFKDDMFTKNGKVEFNRESISQKTGLQGQELTNYLNDSVKGMTNRISAAIQDIDQQIPEHERSILARDARFNFFLSYLNWFTLGIQKKFKSYHYSVSRDSYEEGSYVTAFNFISELITRRREMRQVWNEAITDDTKRRNLKRTAIDIGIAGALGTIVALLSEYFDDEDREMNWITAFTEYMFLRTATEQISSTVALPRQFGEVLENPLPSYQSFTDLFDVLDVFSDEIVDRGSYAGDTKRFRWLARNTPFLKDYARLRDPHRTAQNYMFYNKDVYNWTIASGFFDDPEDEE